MSRELEEGSELVLDCWRKRLPERKALFQSRCSMPIREKLF